MYSGCVDAETYGMFAHENAFLILMLLSLLFPFSFSKISVWLYFYPLEKTKK